LEIEPDDAKSCCARLYEDDFVRLLLGESFHPGGLKLTSRLGQLLRLGRHSRVLDVACGNGASAIHIAETFGCEVTGLDYSEENVKKAAELAMRRGIGRHAHFERGDSERMPFDDLSFDAIICECAFCTFPDKTAAAREFFRVARPGGHVGLSDITRAVTLPPELNSLISWVACIADAKPAEEYARLLRDAGFQVDAIESYDSALKEMVHQIRMRLLGIEVAVALEKMKLPSIDLKAAKQLSRSSLHAISQHQLGYAVITAQR
jgi:SAM-dependent methyltransferase